MPSAASTLLGDRRVAVAITAGMAVSMGRSVPVFDPTRPDPGVYLDAVHRMRSGSGYYGAMDAALSAGGIGPVESTRAFRLPTWFVLARWVPNDRLLWWCFLAVVVITAALVMRLVRYPLAATAGAAVLLFVGLDGFTFPDVWAVPLVVGAAVAGRHRTWWAAIALAGCATAIREVAVLALVGVLAGAWTHRRRWSVVVSTLVTVGGLAVLAAVHHRSVAGYLVPVGLGREAAFFGSSHGFSSVLDMASAWVPGGWLVAVPLYAAALWRLWGHGPRWLLAWLALPLVGFAAHRPEWGALVVPIATAIGVDALAERIVGWRRRGQATGAQPVVSTPSMVNTDAS